MVITFDIKKLSCGVVKLLFEASVQKARNGPSTQLIKKTKHHHHGGAVCPSYGVESVGLPDPARVTSSEGFGRGRLHLV